MKQFEIWLADLDPPFGTEPGKKRPVLVVQTDILNNIGHPSTIIIPITSKIKQNGFPLRIRIEKALSNLDYDSDIVIDQITAIDNKRFISKIDDLPQNLIQSVNLSIGYLFDFG